MVDDKLLELSSKNNSAQFVFINSRDFPDAIKIRGQYSVSGNNVEVNVNIFKGTLKKSSYTTSGAKSDLGKIADGIIKNLVY